MPSQIPMHIDAVTILPPSIDWFMQHIKSLTSTTKLYRDLLSGTALAISDGSFYGSCGWIIATSDGTQWIQGGGIIPGEPNVQSSYRSEAS